MSDHSSKLYLLLPVFATLMVLPSCGNPPPWCGKCPDPKMVRDPLCDCFDPKEKEEQGHKSGGLPANESYASCICKYKDGTVGAWFGFQPAIYKNFGNIVVRASSCSDLAICDRVVEDGVEVTTYLSNRVTIIPQTWNTWQDFGGGGMVWYVLGKQKVGALENMTRFASSQLLEAQRSLIKPAAFTNTLEECATACEVGSPFCYSDQLPEEVASGFGKLFERLQSNAPSIAPADLTAMFGGIGDPCGRGTTNFAGNRISNEGQSCVLSTEVSDPFIGDIELELSVPDKLQGDYAFENGSARLSFNDTDQRPKLTFDDANLNKAWGGTLNGLAGTKNSVLASVGERSCLRFSY